MLEQPSQNQLIQDQGERDKALDPKKSFIVQAPAGSGKTELLTQRILVLLANVNIPEEILAITFTKKAAAEMRARLINTLQRAQDPTPPSSPHATHTWNLAKKVLQRDQVLSWHLLQNPNRLRIQTIDSFNTSLVKHLPISSHFGAPPEITDNAVVLYREAIQEFLSHLEEKVEWADAIAHLLIHLDNDLNKVENLLINMLAKRDQWLPYILMNDDANVLRQYLESHLKNIVVEALVKLKNQFPDFYNDELIELMNFAKQNLLAQGKSSLLTEINVAHLPDCNIEDKEKWLCILEFLLTKELTWRKSFNINMGFPAATSTKVKEEKEFFNGMKQRMSDLIERLAADEALLLLFKELSKTPSANYDELQWQTLQALYQVLRIVVAQLKVVFQRYGKIDYIENAHAALQALGNSDAPTDLALALDYQIKHILIDEFQDTSNSQYRLLEKLLMGWQNNDDRSLFIVGDPMQSIYRFREAEVGLFISAREKGISQIPLTSLTLSVNFRSTNTIVEWINHHFAKAFPQHENISQGAVTYSHSLANQQNIEYSNVHLSPCFEEDVTQAEKIIACIKESKSKNPNETIAILVRSRTHLSSIIPALKVAGLNFRAIDIDALSTRPVIQDLIMLTRALLNPGDRIAWLAILRAPWCGLKLADLLTLARNPDKTLPELLNARSEKLNDKLSEKNLTRVWQILKNKLLERKYYSVRDWIESAWMLLGGPACLQQASELEDAQTYFSLLDELAVGGEIPELEELEHHVEKLFAAPNSAADNSLQIMTIHNAKGLEFDTVILPHLERKSALDEKQLLLWMQRHDDNGTSLVLAPINATGASNDSIYDYIKKQHDDRANHEMGRLLYVAATRAKKNLHLFFNVEMNENAEILAPNSHSLLFKIWESIKDSLPETLTPLTSAQNIQAATTRKIYRLNNEWQQNLEELFVVKPPVEHQSMPGFFLEENNLKCMGTVMHLLLQKISQMGVQWWNEKTVSQQKDYLRYQLTLVNTISSSVFELVNKIMTSLDKALNDPRLLWILQPHKDAQSELPLTTFYKNKLISLIIDRTFIDENNVRWIIDYKTGSPENSLNLQVFLQSEQEKYFEKMRLYFQALKATEKREIRVGLYFPLIAAWHEWSFEPVAQF